VGAFSGGEIQERHGQRMFGESAVLESVHVHSGLAARILSTEYARRRSAEGHSEHPHAGEIKAVAKARSALRVDLDQLIEW
jgi:hypothetical protein